MTNYRRFSDDKLVIATHNSGKLSEIKTLFKNFNFNIVSAASLGLLEPDETENSFQGNALLKAHAAASASQLPALADDSGLAVTALNGAPGVYSARWATPNGNFAKAMQRVESELSELTTVDRSAKLVCSLALAWPDGNQICVEGKVNGDLVWPPRGTKGFGYDAIFRPTGHNLTFGEMEPITKHSMSHRAKAFAQLMLQAFS